MQICPTPELVTICSYVEIKETNIKRSGSGRRKQNIVQMERSSLEQCDVYNNIWCLCPVYIMSLFGEHTVLWEMIHFAPSAALLDREY